ncbi:hypothetical protein XENTR_v10022609 [Xenopus tropicalis]|nr:hypothetical protein XENTR_v10022609 [Xenopus tropicalis]
MHPMPFLISSYPMTYFFFLIPSLPLCLPFLYNSLILPLPHTLSIPCFSLLFLPFLYPPFHKSHLPIILPSHNPTFPSPTFYSHSLSHPLFLFPPSDSPTHLHSAPCSNRHKGHYGTLSHHLELLLGGVPCYRYRAPGQQYEAQAFQTPRSRCHPLPSPHCNQKMSWSGSWGALLP